MPIRSTQQPGSLTDPTNWDTYPADGDSAVIGHAMTMADEEHFNVGGGRVKWITGGSVTVNTTDDDALKAQITADVLEAAGTVDDGEYVTDAATNCILLQSGHLALNVPRAGYLFNYPGTNNYTPIAINGGNALTFSDGLTFDSGVHTVPVRLLDIQSGQVLFDGNLEANDDADADVEADVCVMFLGGTGTLVVNGDLIRRGKSSLVYTGGDNVTTMNVTGNVRNYYRSNFTNPAVDRTTAILMDWTNLTIGGYLCNIADNGLAILVTYYGRDGSTHVGGAVASLGENGYAILDESGSPTFTHDEGVSRASVGEQEFDYAKSLGGGGGSGRRRIGD